MGERFVTCDLKEILIGAPLPADLFIYINFRFITYKLAGDSLDRPTYERFEFNKVKNLFILEKDQPRFEEWARRNMEAMTPEGGQAPEMEQVRVDARHQMSIFQGVHPDKAIEQGLAASKALIGMVMKFPYSVQSLSQLQTYSRDTVDHSINVSILSVYLAMQMGYSHNLILQHVGAGALMHDIGKTLVGVDDSDNSEASVKKMEKHPELGLKYFDGQQKIPNEVRMIVAQHHEHFDGTGYPKKLRSSAIYDLTRIVSIANVFDELVVEGTGTILERQRAAVKELDGTMFRHFDPQKLEKALKILKRGV